MAISQALLGEYDHEMANTRRTLERVPDEKFDWKPHPKSFAMGELAAHIAFIPRWGVTAIETSKFDVNPPGGDPVRPPELKTCKDILAFFDENVAAARAAISGAGDGMLMESWTLLAEGKTVFTLPRIAVLRAFVMNHLIHHRAQLGVYLRLNDIPVPALYGPSADEHAM